jgi:hypothetical protein
MRRRGSTFTLWRPWDKLLNAIKTFLINILIKENIPVEDFTSIYSIALSPWGSSVEYLRITTYT